MRKGKNPMIPNNIYPIFPNKHNLYFALTTTTQIKSSFQGFFFFPSRDVVLYMYHAGTSTSRQRPFQSVMQKIPDAFFFCLHCMKIGLRVLWQKPSQLPPTCLLLSLLFPEGSLGLGVVVYLKSRELYSGKERQKERGHSTDGANWSKRFAYWK